MRILYLTAESFTEPIIQSQVVNLLERLAQLPAIDGITLLTADDAPVPGRTPPPAPARIRHVGTRDRGTVGNALSAIRFAWARRKEYDVVHVRSYVPMLGGVVAKLLLGKRLLFDPRGLFAEEQSYGGGNRMTTFVFKQLERLFCAVADAIVVVSEPFKEHLVARYRLPPDRVTVIPTFASDYAAEAAGHDPVDVRRRFRWEGARIFVYSGSIGRWQMLEEVVTFFARVAHRMPDARFLFLTHPAPELVQLLESELPAGSHAMLRVPPKQLSACLAQCDFGVLFRSDHIINRVSAPIKVKDYLVAGMTVVISAGVGDSSSFVARNDFGLVVSDMSAAEADRVIDAIDAHGPWDRDRIARVSRGAFGIETVSEQYHHVYLTLGQPA